MENCKKSQILKELRLLVQVAKSDRNKGYQFKIKQYNKTINYIENTIKPVETTQCVLEILRENGMKLPNEKGPTWKSSILQKIDKIIKEGSLNIVLNEKNKCFIKNIWR